MLKFLRKKTKIIIWSVIVSFVAWGGYAVSVQFGSSNRAAGRIFGKEVSFREYLRASRVAQLLGSSADQNKEPPTVEEIEARAWQFLVLNREARRRKIKVKDEEVRQQIELLLAQKGPSTLSSEQYHQWVRGALREEPAEFEAQVRESVRNQKLLDEIRKQFKDKTEENLKNWTTELIRQAKPEVFRSPAQNR